MTGTTTGDRAAVRKLLADIEGDREKRRQSRYQATQRQVAAAIDALNQDDDAFRHMPWGALDELVGGIAPATLWYVVMMSGNGKTTFFASFTEAALARGERVYVMATESTPHVFRTHLACRPLGYNPGDLLSGAYRKLPNWQAMRDAVIAEMELVARAEGEAWENLTISDATHFSADSVKRAAAEAAEAKADWFLVDHVDHLESVSGLSEYSVSFEGNGALFQAKNRYGFRALASSQVNHQVTKGNPLAYFTVPQDDWIKFGSHKKEKADGVIGGCRSLRLDGVDEDTLKRYRNKQASMEDVAEPNVMLLAILKHRLYGERLGKRCLLGVQHGRIVDLPERDLGPIHGIRTHRGIV